MSNIYIESSIKRMDVKGQGRLVKALADIKVRKISAICKMQEEDFANTKGIGNSTYHAVKSYLNENGLKFGMTDEEIQAYHEVYLKERKEVSDAKEQKKIEKMKLKETIDTFGETAKFLNGDFLVIAEKLSEIPAPVLVNAAKVFLSLAVDFVDSILSETEAKDDKQI